jgi:ribonuclease HI
MKSPYRSSAPQGQRLFGEPERPAAHIAYIDGASRGNPGPASYAVVVKAPGGKTEFEIGKYFGRATNNVAEYYGLIAALDAAQSHGIQRLLVRSDSELMVRQMQGRYKVKSADLKPLYERALKLSRGFAYFAIEHVPREQNAEADALGNRALDETSRSSSPRSDAMPAAPLSAPSPEPLPSSAARERLRGQQVASAPVGREAVRPTPRVTPGASKIRARYSAGALHPLEALDLDEGEIVEITIGKPASQ